MCRHKKTRISTQPIRVFYYLCPVQPPPKNVLFVLIFGTFRFADYTTSHNDSVSEKKFYKITNYYKSIKGIKIKNIHNYRKILGKGQIVSLDLIHRFFKNEKIYEYIKSIKSIENNEGLPSIITSIDILVFKDNVYYNKLNVYYEKNYSYAVSYKLGYFDKNGVLYYKIFETDEVETLYIKESKDYLLFDGNI